MVCFVENYGEKISFLIWRNVKVLTWNLFSFNWKENPYDIIFWMLSKLQSTYESSFWNACLMRINALWKISERQETENTPFLHTVTWILYKEKHFFIKSKKNRLDVPPFKGSRQLVSSNEKTLSPINVLESFFPNGHPNTIDEIMKRDILNVLFCFYSTLFSWSFFFLNI